MSPWQRYRALLRIGRGVIVERRTSALARCGGWLVFLLVFVPLGTLVFPFISKRLKPKDTGTSEYLYPMF